MYIRHVNLSYIFTTAGIIKPTGFFFGVYLKLKVDLGLSRCNEYRFRQIFVEYPIKDVFS